MNVSLGGNLVQTTAIGDSYLTTTIGSIVVPQFRLGSCTSIGFPGTINLPTITGLLPAGSYYLSGYTQALGESFTRSNFALFLTPLIKPAPSVPDSGSTLMMLGLAICAIGGIFRKVNLA